MHTSQSHGSTVVADPAMFVASTHNAAIRCLRRQKSRDTASDVLFCAFIGHPDLTQLAWLIIDTRLSNKGLWSFG